MSKPFSYLIGHRTKRKKGDTRELAAQLAPLEEQIDAHERAMAAGSIVEQGSGAIVVKSDANSLSRDLIDTRASGRGILGIEPVVLVIVALMLAFIGFIAWQISQMPGE